FQAEDGIRYDLVTGVQTCALPISGRVALPLPVDRGVDPALRTDRVRALDGHDGEQVDGEPRLGDPDGGHQARQPAADDDEAGPQIGRASCRERGEMEAMPRDVEET